MVCGCHLPRVLCLKCMLPDGKAVRPLASADGDFCGGLHILWMLGYGISYVFSLPRLSVAELPEF